MHFRQTLSRRQILKGALGLAGAGLVMPLHGQSPTPPSGQVTIACIGLGAMGQFHLGGLVGMPDCRVVALCDVDSDKLAAANRVAKLHEKDLYADFRRILDRNDIDAVNIATPDHWHTPLAMEAIRAGKAVYVQKPISLTIQEGRRLSELARRTGAIVQTGSQQRSSANFRFAAELVRNGHLGRIQSIEVGLEQPYLLEPGLAPFQEPPPNLDYNLWLGPAPWKPYSGQRVVHFRGSFDYSGGYFSDWGAHHLDIVQWALGMDDSGPIRIDGKGTFHSEGIFNVPMTFDVRYVYADGTPVHASLDYEQGIRFIGSEGSLFVSRTAFRSDPPELLATKLRPSDIRLRQSEEHLQDFFQAIRTGRQPIAPPEVGHRSATVCHLGNISMRLGRPLDWDPVREEFLHDEEANRMRSCASREDWRIG